MKMTQQQKDIDRLGRIAAKVADLNKEAFIIKEALKKSGIDEAEGRMFRVKIVEADRVSLDAKKVAVMLGDKLSLVQRSTHTVSVKVTARKVKK